MECVVVGRGLYAMLNMHEKETPPYTLSREGIARGPAFSCLLILAVLLLGPYALVSLPL